MNRYNTNGHADSSHQQDTVAVVTHIDQQNRSGNAASCFPHSRPLGTPLTTVPFGRYETKARIYTLHRLLTAGWRQKPARLL